MRDDDGDEEGGLILVDSRTTLRGLSRQEKCRWRWKREFWTKRDAEVVDKEDSSDDLVKEKDNEKGQSKLNSQKCSCLTLQLRGVEV